MERSNDQASKAERLTKITQKIGYALWQIQELEGASAEYLYC